MSWRHYCYGLRYLGRAHLRGLLSHAQGARIGAATEDGYRQASTDLKRLLTVPRRSRG